MWLFCVGQDNLLESLPCKLCIINKDGKVLKSNSSFKERFSGIKNMFSFIYAVNKESYHNLLSFVSSENNNEWQCILEMNDTIPESSSPKLKLSKRLDSMVRRTNISSEVKDMVAFKMTVAKLKRGKWICDMIDVTEQVKVEKMLAKIAQTQADLICSIYPKHIVDSLYQSDVINMIARTHDCVTIMFADIVGFTEMSERVSPNVVMKFLNQIFEEFDALNKKFDVFKLETVGDCYVAVSGLFVEDDDGNFVCDTSKSDHVNDAKNMFEFARTCLQTVKRKYAFPHNHFPVRLRIGIHSGPVQSGIIGRKMPKYCLFGDTMNTASRMESTCPPNHIQMSESTFNLLQDSNKQYFVARNPINVKGKGMMQTYVHSSHEEYAVDASASFDIGILNFFETVKESFEISKARSSM